jgi:hypothetical protein
MNKKDEYEIGERLVCRDYIKVKYVGKKGKALCKNFEYKITEIGEDTLTLDNEFTLPIKTIRRSFIHNYCRTCHSFQGLSVDMPITIYDWKCEWASRKWIYTAVTRARQLDQVFFKEYKEEKNPKEEAERTAYLKDKICGYIQQDRCARREINRDHYITVDWLRSCIGKPCHNCGDLLMYERNEKGNITSNLTAQRVNSKDAAHELDNIVPFCIECNRAMSNRE